MDFAARGLYVFPTEIQGPKADLFRYGQWKDRGDIELTESEAAKLRLLTLISLSIEEGLYVNYNTISNALEIPEDDVEMFLLYSSDFGAIDVRLDALNSRAVILDYAERNISEKQLSDTISSLKEIESDIVARTRADGETISTAQPVGRKRHYDESND